MGNICASKDEEIDLLSADLDGRVSPRPPSIGVPSLLDICLEQLSSQLLGNDVRKVGSPLSSPKSTRFGDCKESYDPPDSEVAGGGVSFELDNIPLRGYSSDRDEFDFPYEVKARSKLLRKKKRYIGLCTEPDTLLSADDEIKDTDFLTRRPSLLHHHRNHSSELFIQPNPTPIVFKLAPTIVQAIFNRMTEKKLLNVQNIKLFYGSQLSLINLTSYPKVNDRWFDILFASNNISPSPPTPETPLSNNSNKETKVNTPSTTFSASTSPPSSFASPLYSTSPPSSISSPSSSSPRTLLADVTSFPMSTSLTHFDVSKCDQLTDRALRPLMLCRALKHLNIEGCFRLTDDLVCDIIPSTFNLEYLNCGGCREIGDRLLECLQESKHNLLTLILESCNVSDRGLLCLRDVKKLTHFSIGWCGNRVTSLGLTWVKTNISLEDINVAYTGVESLDFLRNLKNLTKINLAGTKVTEAGLRYVQGVFPKLRELDMQKTSCQEIPLGFLHSNLQSLDASFCRNIPPGKYTLQLAQLSEMLPPCSLPMSPGFERDHCQLRILRLEGSRLNNSCMKSVCSLLNLRELNICDTDVTDDGFRFLPQLPYLAHLNCSGCKITNPGLASLESIVSLTEIHMNCQAITDLGVYHLRNLHNLQVLDLFEATLTDAGIDHLVNMRELKSLEICGGQLTNAGLAKFPVLSNLTSLNVSQNPGITDAGLLPLATLKSLTHINLSGTHVTDKGLSFVHALPSMRALSLFGCKVKQSPKLKALVPKVRIGVDSNIALAAV